jgi:hypothetical protein
MSRLRRTLRSLHHEFVETWGYLFLLVVGLVVAALIFIVAR